MCKWLRQRSLADIDEWFVSNCSCACIWDLRPNNITDQWLLLQDESDFRSGPAVIASHWAVPVRRFARVVHDAERLRARCQSLQDSSKIYVFYTFLYWFFFWWLRETGQGVSGYTRRAIVSIMMWHLWYIRYRSDACKSTNNPTEKKKNYSRRVVICREKRTAAR